jgi:hypothetical protein
VAKYVAFRQGISLRIAISVVGNIALDIPSAEIISRIPGRLRDQIKRANAGQWHQQTE